MAIQQRGDVSGHAAAVQRAGGHVHRQRDLVAGRVVLVEQPDGLGHDPPVDLLDEAEALGIVQKGAGRDEIAVVVGQAQEQLEARNAVGADRHDRLSVQHEALFGDRTPQRRQPVLARHDAFATPRLAPEHRQAVLALGLGIVHRDVGLDEQVLGGQVVTGGVRRDTDRCRHVRVTLAVDDGTGAADVAEQLLGHESRGALVGQGQSDGELVAAHAAHDVGLAQAAPQRAGQPGDEVVSGGVSQRVVDELEAVQVEREHRTAGAAAPGVGEQLTQLFVKAPPVDQPGQGVVVGEILKLRLEPLALGDVEDLPDRHTAPLLVGEGGIRYQRPDDVPVAVQVAPFELHPVDLLLGQATQRRDEAPMQVVGMDVRGHALADELVEPVPEQLGVGLVGCEDGP